MDIHRTRFDRTPPGMQPQITEALAEVSKSERVLCTKVHLQIALLFIRSEKWIKHHLDAFKNSTG